MLVSLLAWEKKFVEVMLPRDDKNPAGYFLVESGKIIRYWTVLYLENVTRVLRGNVHAFNMSAVFDAVYEIVKKKNT